MAKFGKGFIGAILGGLLLAACNGGTDGGGTPVSDADMIGIWNVLTMHEKGTEKTTVTGQTPVVENKDTTTTFSTGSTMEFKSDKTCSMNLGFPFTGTWSASGSSVTIIATIFGQKDTSVSTITLDGKNGTFVEVEKKTRTFGPMTMETDMVTTIKATKQ